MGETDPASKSRFREMYVVRAVRLARFAQREGLDSFSGAAAV